ncbi:MAG: hypothetical protein WCW27_05985 [Patescibacteria group bacterium]|jgi:predicted transcriptional regulator of viral defense system
MIKKLKRIKVEEKIKAIGLQVFTPREFREIFAVSANTASVFITNNIKSGLFIKLRNNFYILKDSNPAYFFIANKLCSPSYISLQSALSYYQIIPEVVYTTTSVTTKISKEFSTIKGDFIYHHIKRNVFTGYSLKLIDQAKVLIADPEKALADYLYFVDLKRLILNDRLKLRYINKNNLITYIKLFTRPGMFKLMEQIYAEYKKPRKIY